MAQIDGQKGPDGELHHAVRPRHQQNYQERPAADKPSEGTQVRRDGEDAAGLALQTAHQYIHQHACGNRGRDARLEYGPPANEQHRADDNGPERLTDAAAGSVHADRETAPLSEVLRKRGDRWWMPERDGDVNHD